MSNVDHIHAMLCRYVDYREKEAINDIMKMYEFNEPSMIRERKKKHSDEMDFIQDFAHWVERNYGGG